MSKIIEINSLDELDTVAEAVINSLDGRTVVAFDAPMGAGKTTLISRIAALLGAEDSVTSPTFAIVNQYEGTKHTIYHFDMYRIERVEEALDFGSEEYLSSGDLCLVEWPEKIEPLLPDDTMVVRIEILSDTARRFEIQ
ncbi:MAG: tRNA (adenosine(37)-N6)-threonylcarbamoyltransferase complex ATPase subunit type 1 TsaE [Alistipes sp.]|jgi:tRNA threonylcarbamoyladenosine biosynthesis protein TsaE|nr:tRNA (adenosine(37)-N6)-threonylcarbamoyltransferase complex ATPase subunit type 1 TsaE [Alistipes sp.]MBQ2143319.1 tRNA (adenosine(37)-N6)-threonylcarbamoyltransferase complex ATPase subunit type 1 TsaE [Alistipes sp.]MBR0362923.1 tRNA (adenosine(37)-N6)-threonylcarbamoyltransferase complex ATPase subunit type 1 TsaE [Alistipes sp.]